MSRWSSLDIRDLKDEIDKMCPVEIFLNGVLVWDDGDPAIGSDDYYRFILSCDAKVSSIKYDIVDFHHSIVYIETVKE